MITYAIAETMEDEWARTLAYGAALISHDVEHSTEMLAHEVDDDYQYGMYIEDYANWIYSNDQEERDIQRELAMEAWALYDE